MKTHYCKPLLAIIFILNAHLLFAQEVIRQESCDIRPYQEQIDSVKSLFTSKGYILLREASMTMESEYEMPIVVPMTQGALYEFVFIGDPSSRLYEVRMYDNDEKQVLYKKNMWGDVDGNIISYAYIPQFTEYHMIKPVQVNKKKKKICGYVMLLKKVKGPQPRPADQANISR
ncbi:MAG: hypothetical protein Q8939_11485 [Bacteroidota bacterium]|nr:hypothetical protein [Bacteroidota bacterium]MDP4211968.1 hypothetical protein [Bacteroidota bacterium]